MLNQFKFSTALFATLLNSHSVLATAAAPQNTCLGTPEETLRVLESLRQYHFCANSSTLECESRLGAVAAGGAVAALTAAGISTRLPVRVPDGVCTVDHSIRPKTYFVSVFLISNAEAAVCVPYSQHLRDNPGILRNEADALIRNSQEAIAGDLRRLQQEVEADLQNALQQNRPPAAASVAAAAPVPPTSQARGDLRALADSFRSDNPMFAGSLQRLSDLNLSEGDLRVELTRILPGNVDEAQGARIQALATQMLREREQARAAPPPRLAAAPSINPRMVADHEATLRNYARSIASGEVVNSTLVEEIAEIKRMRPQLAPAVEALEIRQRELSVLRGTSQNLAMTRARIVGLSSRAASNPAQRAELLTALAEQVVGIPEVGSRNPAGAATPGLSAARRNLFQRVAMAAGDRAPAVLTAAAGGRNATIHAGAQAVAFNVAPVTGMIGQRANAAVARQSGFTAMRRTLAVAGGAAGIGIDAAISAVEASPLGCASLQSRFETLDDSCQHTVEFTPKVIEFISLNSVDQLQELANFRGFCGAIKGLEEKYLRPRNAVIGRCEGEGSSVTTRPDSVYGSFLRGTQRFLSVGDEVVVTNQASAFCSRVQPDSATSQIFAGAPVGNLNHDCSSLRAPPNNSYSAANPPSARRGTTVQHAQAQRDLLAVQELNFHIVRVRACCSGANPDMCPEYNISRNSGGEGSAPATRTGTGR